MVDIEHVRELCKKATPGPYHVYYPDPNDAWEAFQEEDRTNPCEHHQAVVSAQAGQWADFARFVVCVQGEPDEAGFANVRLYQQAITLLPEMADEIERLRRENAAWKELASIASETLHNPADMRPEEIGTGEDGLWRIMQDVGSMLARGPDVRQ
jgi:hypothetical protein